MAFGIVKLFKRRLITTSNFWYPVARPQCGECPTYAPPARRCRVFVGEAPETGPEHKDMLSHDQADQNAIEGLIQRERTARDTGQWAEMADCYQSESYVEVSWFQGSGKDFAERSSKIAGGEVYTFHMMSPAVVTLGGDRALAETGCTVHGLTQLDGMDIDIVSCSRLLWRAQRAGSGWLIAGMRAYYLSDAIMPTDPTRVPKIHQEIFGGLRRSYRSIAYVMAQSGFPVRDDLAGIDQPDTVVSLRAQEQQWLRGG